MPPGNTLVGDELPIYASDSPSMAQPVTPTGYAPHLSAQDANRIANYVAFLVLLALAVLILIRIGGLQGMIAVGRAG